jgi:signal transduction histidine kinase
VSISLGREGSFIEFVIQDNGKGFNVKAMLSSGMGVGLLSTRERAVLTGKLFNLISNPQLERERPSVFHGLGPEPSVENHYPNAT